MNVFRPDSVAADVRSCDDSGDEPCHVGGALCDLAAHARDRGDLCDADFAEWDDFSLAQATAAKPATRGLQIGFVAPSRAHVDEFWRLGRANGSADAGLPGERPHYKPDYYGAFLLDPDGNSIEAVHHGSLRTGGAIHHLWLRAGDFDVSRRFYEVVAQVAGLGVHNLSPEHVQLVGSSGSISVVAGEPTRNVHLAFPAATNAPWTSSTEG